MLQYREINMDEDRGVLLELHCRINYESETPFARKASYEEYRKKWLSTSQPESYLKHLKRTIDEGRGIAEILEDDGVLIGYLWVSLTEVEGYDMTVAHVMDILVVPDYQRRGIGTVMIKHIEEAAKKKGATLLRSDTGIENIASQKLHEKSGFKPYRIHYEKTLS